MFQGDAGSVATTSRHVARAATSPRHEQISAPTIQLDHVPDVTYPETGSRTPRRTLLMIASRFPPVASVGAIRVRKFAKYLGDHGWNVVVVTGSMRRGNPGNQDARRATDPESLLDVPATVRIHRLNPVVDHWPTYLNRSLSSRLAALTGRFGMDASRWSRILSWRLEKLHDRLSFPDRGIWRLPGVMTLVRRLNRTHRFDAVFSSGMPFSDHIIGLAVHEMIRRPWLVDFRDPWLEYIHWQQWETPMGQRLTGMAEAAVMRRAARVISVNQHMTERFADRYRSLGSRKFVTIENGFDPADFVGSSTTSRSTEFRLLYAGSLYKTRSPEAALTGFRRFVAKTPGAAARARFEFAGRPGPYMAEFSNASDEGRIRYLGMLGHGETLRRMAAADVNVILLPNVPGGANDSTAKVYECLGSGRPILAAIPADGAAARLLSAFDGVWRCEPDNPDSIAAVLGDLYRRWLSGDLHVARPDKGLEPLTRRFQTAQLAEQLAAVMPRQDA